MIYRSMEALKFSTRETEKAVRSFVAAARRLRLVRPSRGARRHVRKPAAVFHELTRRQRENISAAFAPADEIIGTVVVRGEHRLELLRTWDRLSWFAAVDAYGPDVAPRKLTVHGVPVRFWEPDARDERGFARPDVTFLGGVS